MLFRILLSNTGFMIGVVVEGVITLVSLILIILVAKFGLPNFEAKERKPKKAKAPKAEKEKYVLKYVAGEGSGESPALEQYAKGAKVVLKSNMFATPTGKIFDGWSDGEKTYFPSQKYVMPAQPVTFTAQWGIPEAKYPLRYVAGEGSGEEPTVENYAKGTKVILKANMFVTPVGKQFDGWSDGVNKYSSKFAITMPAQGVTLTAQWKEVKKDEPEAEESVATVEEKPKKKATKEQSKEVAATETVVSVDSNGEAVEQLDGGTTPDGRPIIVNVYNTHGGKNTEKTIEKEIIHEKDDDDDNGLEFANYSILQLYELLSDEQKRYFDTLKDAAMAKPQAKLSVGHSFFNIKIGKRSILKLRIKRMITVGEYSLENDILKDFRKASDNKAGNAKIKVRPTLVAVTDEATLETAMNMIDLVHKQILEG